MNIKNADLPAMPLALEVCVNEHGTTTVNDAYDGLTKREMFAKDAPDVLDSFRFDFIKRNHSNKDLVLSFSALSPSSAKLSVIGEMKLIKEWRYAYADLMLED